MRAKEHQRIVSPARKAAFRILGKVDDENAYASILLAADIQDLRADDRALCHELVLGVLRRQLWLDALITHYASRDAEKLDPPIRRALRMGLYQLRFLSKIPTSAAVNESVNLAHSSRLNSAAPFINAVLRRAARESDYDPTSEIADPIERLAIETSHPRWMIQRWIGAFGRMEAEAFARANNEPPPVAFRVVCLPDKESVIEALDRSGVVARPSELTPGAWRVEKGVARLRKFAEAGKVYIQDEASQLVAQILGAKLNDRVLDVCSAPGGKATQIAAQTPEIGFVVAGDLHEHRARTIATAVKTQRANKVHVVVHDAEASLPYPDRHFDRVLVDAPCSGTGTLRRNPEIRWRLAPSDIPELAAKQSRILSEASRKVRIGGKLVYSTCSVEPEENEAVAQGFLSGSPDFKQVEIREPNALRTATGAARTWPQKHGVDGFFITMFERRS